MLRPENGQDRKKQRIRVTISGGEKKTGRMRKSYTENFKRKVAIEKIREKKTVAKIAKEYGVAPSLVTEWKQRFINGEDSKEVRQIKQYGMRLSCSKKTDKGREQDVEAGGPWSLEAGVQRERAMSGTGDFPLRLL